MSQAPVVRTEALTNAYGHSVALRDVDLEIEPGEIFGYLGPNGAGKTTTLWLPRRWARGHGSLGFRRRDVLA